MSFQNWTTTIGISLHQNMRKMRSELFHPSGPMVTDSALQSKELGQTYTTTGAFPPDYQYIASGILVSLHQRKTGSRYLHVWHRSSGLIYASLDLILETDIRSEPEVSQFWTWTIYPQKTPPTWEAIRVPGFELSWKYTLVILMICRDHACLFTQSSKNGHHPDILTSFLTRTNEHY